MGSSNAFPVPDGTLLDYVFSIFHFYEVVNCKLQSLWIGSGYINLCTFRHTIKVTDHHGDGAEVVPCELITFDYTHQSLEMSTCRASFDHSTMAVLWLECGRRHKHEIDTLSACDLAGANGVAARSSLGPHGLPVTRSTGDHIKSNVNFSQGTERKITKFIATPINCVYWQISFIASF